MGLSSSLWLSLLVLLSSDSLKGFGEAFWHSSCSFQVWLQSMHVLPWEADPHNVQPWLK
jgi:hypothetical protein